MGLGLKRDYRFIQGFFKPKNPSKYIGKEPPIFRSGIELKFFKFCDDSDNVIKWCSEPLGIPYFDPIANKHRKYYVDNFVEIREGTTTKKYLIEIKAIKETKKPVRKQGKKKTTLLFEEATYTTNMCKWISANQFCKDNKMEFLLLGYSLKNGFEAISIEFK